MAHKNCEELLEKLLDDPLRAREKSWVTMIKSRVPFTVEQRQAIEALFEASIYLVVFSDDRFPKVLIVRGKYGMRKFRRVLKNVPYSLRFLGITSSRLPFPIGRPEVLTSVL